MRKIFFPFEFVLVESNRHNVGKEEILIQYSQKRDTVFPIYPTICHFMTEFLQVFFVFLQSQPNDFKKAQKNRIGLF